MATVRSKVEFSLCLTKHHAVEVNVFLTSALDSGGWLYLINLTLRGSEKLTVVRLIKKLLAFYGTKNSITMFTGAPYLSPSWARCIHSTTSQILPCHLHLDLPSGLFPSNYPAKFFYHFSTVSMLATFPAHLILLDFIILIIFDTNYEPHNTIFSTLLPLPPSSVQIFSSAPCSLTHKSTFATFM